MTTEEAMELDENCSTKASIGMSKKAAERSATEKRRLLADV